MESDEILSFLLTALGETVLSGFHVFCMLTALSTEHVVFRMQAFLKNDRNLCVYCESRAQKFRS